MMKYSKVTLLSVALGAFLLPVAAQTSSAPVAPGAPPATTAAPPSSATAPAAPASTGPADPNTINQQKNQQDRRIANGLANGSLTTQEADALEKQQKQLNEQERQMKAANGGTLTPADKAQLQQQQKALSNQIYQSKHNAAVRNTDPKSGIGKTEQTQQEHIAQGLKSGQLTAGESTHLENQEAKINSERANDLAANGDKLTPQEKAQIKQQQKQVSKQIYKDKHNNAKR
ncbi:MAG TPA: hypothetical protein VN950_28035 [Terriglobales bacterium]|nr:hypothetical protein [Terriglobales bacterium]